jgi:hypothetical protein
LQSVFPDATLSQEEIVRNLEIDAYPESSKGPQKVRAYQGSEAAVRQKFERDKARIRELGFRDRDGDVGRRHRRVPDRSGEWVRADDCVQSRRGAGGADGA